jgi:GDPmannose 4,6-dehydratase
VARRAFVTGIGGQDGSYLAELLLSKGYEVHGTLLGSPSSYQNLTAVRDRLAFVELDLSDSEAVADAIRELQPDETYHLASASFVPASWDDPVGTSTFSAASVGALLAALRDAHPGGRFLNAASAEIFGPGTEAPRSESMPISPASPYGAAKAFAYFLTGAFRERYGLHACSAILFNHESPRRPEQFVTRKISRGAAAISLGLQQELLLGDLGVTRDWGYAGDYVRAMRLMVQAREPEDLVVATGEGHTVEDFLAVAFTHVGLDWREHVRHDKSLSRGAAEPKALVGDSSRARKRLGWEPTVGFEQLVHMLVDADLELLRRQSVVSAAAGDP